MPTKNIPILPADQALTVLDVAEKLITSGWVQGCLAVDEDGHHVQPQSERAVKWCELGAIQAATYYIDGGQPEGPAYRYALSIFNAANTNILAESTFVGSAVPNINDNRGTNHEKVIGMFQKAKRWLEKQQAVAAGKW